MSKIKLTGSNSGYVEISSAADAGNLTLALPTSGTVLLSNGDNVYTGITTFTNDLKLEGGSYDVLWDASDNQLEFDDNAKLSFGASSDLLIFHDGNHSFIQDQGFGSLVLKSNQINLFNAAGNQPMVVANQAGSVDLFFSNSKKLETTNTGVVVSGICTATAFVSTAGQLSNRNLAINGAMRVAQRGTSTTISTGNNTNASGVYTVDRMKLGCYVGSERYTLSQETDAPTGSGFTKSFKIKTSTADTSANAGTYAQFVYQIEGQDLQHLLKGTSSAKPLTFSFWVKGNTNYTPVAELKDNSNVRINVQTFNVTTSWTKVVLTYVGDTTGTIDDDNTAGLTFNIWLKAAAFYSGGTSPAQNTWVPQSNHNIRAALLTFDIATSTDNYFQITGLQIEVGDTATPFEHRSYGEELSRCMRYYEGVYMTDGTAMMKAYASYGGSANFEYQFKVEKRARPTWSLEGNASWAGATPNAFESKSACLFQHNGGTLFALSDGADELCGSFTAEL